MRKASSRPKHHFKLLYYYFFLNMHLINITKLSYNIKVKLNPLTFKNYFKNILTHKINMLTTTSNFVNNVKMSFYNQKQK